MENLLEKEIRGDVKLEGDVKVGGRGDGGVRDSGAAPHPHSVRDSGTTPQPHPVSAEDLFPPKDADGREIHFPESRFVPRSRHVWFLISFPKEPRSVPESREAALPPAFTTLAQPSLAEMAEPPLSPGGVSGQSQTTFDFFALGQGQGQDPDEAILFLTKL